jgi:hypothetical protein
MWPQGIALAGRKTITDILEARPNCLHDFATTAITTEAFKNDAAYGCAVRAGV